MGERFHDPLQICKVKFGRPSWFRKVDIDYVILYLSFFGEVWIGLTSLLIQAEELWCRRGSFERSSKYKQILINSGVIYKIPAFQFGCLDILYYLKKLLSLFVHVLVGCERIEEKNAFLIEWMYYTV